MDGWGANRALDEGRALKQQYQLHELVLKHDGMGFFLLVSYFYITRMLTVLSGRGGSAGVGEPRPVILVT